MKRCVFIGLLLTAFAMVGGETAAAAQDGFEVSAPERVVQLQVEAYNARDLEAFLAHSAEDVEIFGFPPGLHGCRASKRCARRTARSSKAHRS